MTVSLQSVTIGCNQFAISCNQFSISFPSVAISKRYFQRLLAQTTLRNTLGMKTLSELLADRDEISGTMQQLLDVATDPWGITVERVEVKDVVLPTNVSFEYTV